jgi:hypothetical protein
LLAKSQILNLESTSDVEQYNNLLKKYHQAVILGQSELNGDDKTLIDSQMDSFKTHFKDKNIKIETKIPIDKELEFENIDINNLKAHLQT